MAKFVATLFVLLVSIFLFPTFNSVCSAYTGELNAIINVFPIIWLAFLILLLVYFALERR